MHAPQLSARGLVASSIQSVNNVQLPGHAFGRCGSFVARLWLMLAHTKAEQNSKGGMHAPSLSMSPDRTRNMD